MTEQVQIAIVTTLGVVGVQLITTLAAYLKIRAAQNQNLAETRLAQTKTELKIDDNTAKTENVSKSVDGRVDKLLSEIDDVHRRHSEEIDNSNRQRFNELKEELMTQARRDRDQIESLKVALASAQESIQKIVPTSSP